MNTSTLDEVTYAPSKNRGNGLDRGLRNVEKASKDRVEIDEKPCRKYAINHEGYNDEKERRG
jgi:hypothetical protein